MGVGHGRTSALNDPLTDSSQIPDGHSPCTHQRLAGVCCRNSRMTTHHRGGSGGGTVCCGLRRCLLTWAAVMMLIPANVEAFAIPLDFFLPLQRTVQRVRASYYRPEVYKTDDRPPRKPSLMRLPATESNVQHFDTDTHPKETSSDKRLYFPLQPKLIPTNKKQNPINKREGGGCMFHAGLAHNCEYKSLVKAFDDLDHWNSFMSPGKKKRSGNSWAATKRRRPKNVQQAMDVPSANVPSANVPSTAENVWSRSLSRRPKKLSLLMMPTKKYDDEQSLQEGRLILKQFTENPTIRIETHQPGGQSVY